MSADEQYAAAVEKCEIAARSHGHALGVWLPVHERLRASVCGVCGALALVVRPGYEERWRPGGMAFERGCFAQEAEDRGAALGA